MRGILLSPTILLYRTHAPLNPSEQPKGFKMKYLSFSELRQKLGGRGRTTVYRDVDAKRLPKPIKLGGRLYWIEHEVDDALSNAQREAV